MVVRLPVFLCSLLIIILRSSPEYKFVGYVKYKQIKKGVLSTQPKLKGHFWVVYFSG